MVFLYFDLRDYNFSRKRGECFRSCIRNRCTGNVIYKTIFRQQNVFTANKLVIVLLIFLCSRFIFLLAIQHEIEIKQVLVTFQCGRSSANNVVKLRFYLADGILLLKPNTTAMKKLKIQTAHIM